MSYFESEEYNAILIQSQTEGYKPYRITLGYINYQYNQKNPKWHKIYALLGGNEVWKHHTNFIQNWWNHFPPKILRILKEWEMTLFDITVTDIKRATELDNIEFDKAILNESVPTSYFDFIRFFPINRPIEKECTSVQEAIDYVSALPIGIVKMRWIDNQSFRDIHFKGDGSYISIYHRSEFRVESDGAVVFKPPFIEYPSLSMKGRKIDFLLSPLIKD